jgi:hypothetical protein
VTELDRASLDGLLPATTSQADWDDVMSRSGAHERRRRLVIVLATVAIVAVGAASALAVRAYLDKGFVGLPPAGAAPSTPKKGELILSYDGRPTSLAREQARPQHRVWVYTDGRLIWDREGSRNQDGNLVDRSLYRPFHANRHTTGLLEQRLTPKGVALLRSEAMSTGLFERDRALTSGFIFGVDFLWGYIRVRNGDQLVLVEWYPLNPGDPPHPARFRDPTQRQVEALDRLTARLASPGSWLPAGAWADRRIKAYVPRRYAVCLESADEQPSRVFALLPDSAKDRLRTKRLAADGCYHVPTEGARAIAKALDDAGLDRQKTFSLAYDVTRPFRTSRITEGYVKFLPILPHGEVACACG